MRKIPQPIFLLLLIPLPLIVWLATRNAHLTLYLFLAQLAGFILCYLTSPNQRRHLQPLIKWIHQLQAGNYDEPPELSQADDDDELANALRSLTASLRESRHKDQADLLRYQQTTRSAVNSLPHAVAVLSADGKIELVNLVAENLFNLHPGQFPPPAAQKWLLPLIDQATASLKPTDSRGLDAAIQVFDKNQELFFLPHAIPILDENQKLVGITLMLVDATQLRQIDEAKSSLLSTVSHELKTPLTSIQMSLHLLLDNPPAALNPRQLDLLKTASEDADRLHHLIQQTLDTARKAQPPIR